jgi:hypothetical protein
MTTFKIFLMKNKLIINTTWLPALVLVVLSGCNKLLDKKPETQIVTPTDNTTISATDAENSIAGLYRYYKADGVEFNIFDRLTNADVMSDNAYAGGDNSANITQDLFTFNSLNGNMDRDWRGFYTFIGKANITIDQVQRSVDPALTATRKNQILGEARFLRAFSYFDLVRMFGRVPIMLTPPVTTNAEALLNSVLVPQSSADSVYKIILQDLWFAKANVRDIGANPSKYIISKGAVNATLAKIYAFMPTPNWDSVKYYCDLVIPNYTLVTDYNFLWDNAHDNNSEAIWEINYDGWSNGDQVGNWAPSIFVGGSIGNYEGGGWKKFTTPSNDLVNAFNADGDDIRKNATLTFLNISGQWTDPYWPVTAYPFLTKYNDPSGGINDFYMIRLADILLLKAEALVELNDIPGAMNILNNQVRARVSLGPKTAANADAARTVIANERRLELAFEGHRWFDLIRTGKAVSVMNAQKDGSGNNLNYNVQPFRLLFPIPQQQIDLNPLLTQNPNY